MLSCFLQQIIVQSSRDYWCLAVVNETNAGAKLDMTLKEWPLEFSENQLACGFCLRQKCAERWIFYKAVIDAV